MVSSNKWEARAWKRALTLQLRRLLAEQEVTKSEMAARMRTSRAAVDRLLDVSNALGHIHYPGQRRGSALGRKIKIELVPA